MDSLRVESLADSLHCQHASPLDLEKLDDLAKEVRIVASDPAALRKNLRLACTYLGTHAHGKADQLVGTMVAIHASRMLTTVWTVLFQVLQEQQDSRGKIVLIKHFAHICDRIILTERQNAFRVFCQEALLLIGDVKIIADTSFCRSFDVIVDTLGLYALEGDCSRLFQVISDTLISCERSDVLRNAASLVSKLVSATNQCGSLADLLVFGETKCRVFTSLLLLDNCYSTLLREQKESGYDPAVDAVIALGNYMNKALKETFFSNEVSFASLPIVVACYEKMKRLSCTWTCFSEEDVCCQVLDLLANGKAKKVALPALLHYLELTPARWWHSSHLLWEIVEDGDSTVRFNALSSLAVALMDGATDSELPAILNKMLFYLLKYTNEDCSYTVCGVIKVLTHLFIRLLGSHINCVVSVKRFFQIVFDLTKPVNNNPSVIIHVFEVIRILPFVHFNAVNYVACNMKNSNVNARKKAIETMMYFCKSITLDGLLFSSDFFSQGDFIENSICGDADVHTCFLSPVGAMQNFRVVLEYLLEEVNEVYFENDKTLSDTVQYMCQSICDFVEIGSLFFSTEELNLLKDNIFSILLVVSQRLQAAEVFSISSFTSVLNACKTCALYGDVGAFLNVFDHHSFFNFIFGIVHACCRTLDPILTFPLREENCLYFSRCELSNSLSKMIILSSEAALQNNESYDKTDFYFFVESNLALLDCLMAAGSHSQPFLEQLSVLFPLAVPHFNSLAGFHPAPSLRLTRTLFETIFLSPKTIKLFKTERAKVAAAGRAFAILSGSVISRSLSFNFGYVGGDVCNLLNSFLKFDALYDTTIYYDVVDRGFDTVQKIVAFLSDRRMHLHHRGELVADLLVKYIFDFYNSKYAGDALRSIPYETIVSCLSALDENEFSSGCVRHPERQRKMQRVLFLYDANGRSSFHEDFELLLAHPYALDSTEFFDIFERICESYRAEEPAMRAIIAQLNSEELTTLPSFSAIVCGAALDCLLIPRAVSMVLTTTGYPTYLVELLLVIMSECAASNLSPLHARLLAKADLSTNLMTLVVKGYKWGWICDDNTNSKEVDALVSSWKHEREGELWDPKEPYSFVAFAAKGSLNQRATEKTCTTKLAEFIGTLPLAPHVLALGLQLKEDVTDELNEHSIQQLFDVCGPSAVAHYIEWAGVQGSFEALTCDAVIQMARVLGRSSEGIDSFSVGLPNAHTAAATPDASAADPQCIQVSDACLVLLLTHLLSLLDANAASEGEKAATLRYSVLFVAASINAPNRSVNTNEMMLRLISCALRTDMVSERDIAEHVVKFALRPSSVFKCVETSTCWLAVSFLSLVVWEVIASESLACFADVETLRFLCQWSQLLRLPSQVLKKMHTRVMALLSSTELVSCTVADADCTALWLATSLLLNVLRDRDTTTHGTSHAFCDGMLEGDCRHQTCTSSPVTTFRIRAYTEIAFLPSSLRAPLRLSARLLPLRTPKEADHPALVATVQSSCLHLLTTFGQKILCRSGLNAASPYRVTHLFTILTVLPPLVFQSFRAVASSSTSSHASSPLPSSLNMYSPTFVEVLKAICEWSRSYAVPVLAKADTQQSAWTYHSGLLPAPMPVANLCDSFCIIAAVKLVSSLTTAELRKELSTGEGDGNKHGLSTLSSMEPAEMVDRMLGMDLVLHCGALTVVAAACESAPPGVPPASAACVAAPIAFSAARRFGGDIQVGGDWGACTGPLLFVARHIMHCATLIARVTAGGGGTAASGDGVTGVAGQTDGTNPVAATLACTRVSESIWHCVSEQQSLLCWGRPVLHGAHKALQALVNGAARGSAQWEMLCVLIMDASYTTEMAKVMRAKPPVGILAAASPLPRHETSITVPHYAYSHQCALPVDPLTRRMHCGTSGSAASTQLAAEDCELMMLATRAAVLLRAMGLAVAALRTGKGEDALDRCRVQMIDLLSHPIFDAPFPLCHPTPAAFWTIHSAAANALVLEAAAARILPAQDAFLVALGRFGRIDAVAAAPRSRRAVLHDLLRVTFSSSSSSDASGTGSDAASWLTVFLETALRLACSEQECWWIACAIGIVQLSVRHQALSRAAAGALVVPWGGEKLCALATFRLIAASGSDAAATPKGMECVAFWKAATGIAANTHPASRWAISMVASVLDVLQATNTVVTVASSVEEQVSSLS